MSSSRAVPFALLSSAIALILLAPGGAPPHEAGDAGPEPAPATAGTLAVDLADGLDPADVSALGARVGLTLRLATEVSADEALYVADVPDLAAAAAALEGVAEVEAVEPVYEIRLVEPAADPPPGAGRSPRAPDPAPRVSDYPDDPLYPKQWNFNLVDAQVGWRAGGGRGALVAVVDTGVTPLPDLPADRILEGRSFVIGAPTAADDHGHGTHVAGTIAQATNNGAGTAGIAPNARILPLKVLGKSGGGLSTWIAAAIDEAVDQRADVINLSLGGGHSQVIVNAVEKARKAGVVVIAAAGNTGREGLGSPADAPAAIAVTAVGPTDALAPYSSWGKGVELAAPGGDKTIPGGGIVQATIEGKTGQQFAEWQGTSMAAPHVAGAAAVLIGAGAASADEVERYLKEPSASRQDPLRFGAGRLDVRASVQRLLLAKQGFLFAVGALVTLGLGALGALPAPARTAAFLYGAVVAGGLFFLPLLPLPPSRGLELLSAPLLAWPGPFWSGFPLWQSCLVPLGVGFVLGPSRFLGPLALGLCGGVGAHLLYGAATGGTDLWWMPGGLDRAWLTVNGTLCLLGGMAVAGMQKMRRSAR